MRSCSWLAPQPTPPSASSCDPCLPPRWAYVWGFVCHTIIPHPFRRHESEHAELPLGRSYRSTTATLAWTPSQQSERRAIFAPDPTQLAALGLKDADAALALLPGGAPDAPEGQLCRGRALSLLERYGEAEAAYTAGLAEQPTHEQLQAQLQQLRAALADGQAGGGGVAAGSGPAAGGNGGSREQASGQERRRLEELTDDTDCTLCMRLLYDPGGCWRPDCRKCTGQRLLLPPLLRCVCQGMQQH